MVKDEVPKRERKKIAPPTPTQLPQVTPLEQLVTVNPSPKPVPQTTSSMIGWRSTDKTCKLERYGSYAKPRGSLVKSLNWPTEGVD